MAVSVVAACTPGAESRPERSTNSSGVLESEEPADASVQAVAACLREKGWLVVIHDGGVGPSSLPEEQVKAYTSDMTACMSEFERDVPSPTLDRSQMVELYRKELATRECLAAQGYESPAAPPSEATYVAALASGSAPPWMAYDAVGQVALEEFRRIERLCPQPTVT